MVQNHDKIGGKKFRDPFNTVSFCHKLTALLLLHPFRPQDQTLAYILHCSEILLSLMQ